MRKNATSLFLLKVGGSNGLLRLTLARQEVVVNCVFPTRRDLITHFGHLCLAFDPLRYFHENAAFLTVYQIILIINSGFINIYLGSRHIWDI